MELKKVYLQKDGLQPGDKIIHECREVTLGGRKRIRIASLLSEENKTVNPDGSTTYSLTQSDHLPVESDFFNGLDEGNVLEKIIKLNHHEMVFEDLFKDKTMPVYFTTEVKEPILEKHSKTKPGDIDIIAFQEPDNVIGIECKWIKHVNQNGIISKWNKRRNIKKAWKQLKGYRKLGFNQTYLLLIIADDQSENTTDTTFFRELQNPLNGIIEFNEDNDSGIIILTVSKVTHAHFANQHTAGSILVRTAKTENQNEFITRVMNDFLNNEISK
ncbi:hypothetical protein [uncultured Nonlabens sp.]|uniref:hypothetical protein n=1 Tax=uncultured Nonlabens sp. TaxID=859306 RepID=UPI00260D618E|nr:hypothetical protein [uncultured Nonlabens sp.]